MIDSDDLKELLHSTALWFALFTVSLFCFLIWGARPALHALGLLFELLGGQGLEGTGL